MVLRRRKIHQVFVFIVDTCRNDTTSRRGKNVDGKTKCLFYSEGKDLKVLPSLCVVY
jgi:hypothetical protein